MARWLVRRDDGSARPNRVCLPAGYEHELQPSAYSLFGNGAAYGRPNKVATGYIVVAPR